MNYTVYSFGAVSRLRQGAKQVEPGPSEGEVRDAAQLRDPQKLTGLARITGIGEMTPWYSRLFRRLLGGPIRAGFHTRP